MKSTLKFLSAAFIVTFLSAFSPMELDGLEITYGVSDNDPSQIELKLMSDFTFTYHDLSNTSNPIKFNGTYVVNKNFVTLKANDIDYRFHHKWRLSKDKSTAKSRKGLAFYTIHRK